jgi:hypothetical protein
MKVAAGIAVVTTAAIGTAAAWAAGIAPGTMTGGPGVADLRAGVRYVAVPSSRGTTVQAIGSRDGRVVRSRLLRGSYGVPLVTFSGAAGGLSHDGRTLVLEGVRTSRQQQYLRSRSRFVALRARSLKPSRVIVLRGDLSFDALSPGGRRLFLIQHAWAGNVARYAVRVYDLHTGRLAQRAVVDKDEPNMAGLPMRRATGPGSRWVYTLYNEAGGGFFVHALDTVGVRAVCIDLPATADLEAIGRAHLVADPGGRRLDVVGSNGKVLYSIDLTTFKVTRP